MSSLDDWEASIDGSDWDYYQVQGKLSDESLSEWIAHDRWSYYEAACLLVGFTPYPDIRVFRSKRFTFSVGGEMTHKGVEKANRLLALFESAEWPSDGTLVSDFMANQKTYRAFAESKSISIFPAVEKALASQQIQNIDPKMINTLSPLINHIHQFGKSQEFQKYKGNLQKGIIASWLVSEGNSKRYADIIAPFIWDHYRSSK